MKQLIVILALTAASFAQGGTTSSNIFPATTGQDLGKSTQRWDLFAQDVDVRGTLTVKQIAGWRYENQYTGDDLNARVQAAIDDINGATAPTYGGGAGIVVIPSTESTADELTVTVPADENGTKHIAILDFRGNHTGGASTAMLLSDGGTTSSGAGPQRNPNGPQMFQAGISFDDPATNGGQAGSFVAKFSGTAGNGASFPLNGITSVAHAHSLTQTSSNAPLVSNDATISITGTDNSIDKAWAYASDGIGGGDTAATGTVSELVGFMAPAWIPPAGLTITNSYGFKAQYPRYGTNNYPLYIDGPNTYFNADGGDTASQSLPIVHIRGNSDNHTGAYLEVVDSKDGSIIFQIDKAGTIYAKLGFQNWSGDTIVKNIAESGNVKVMPGVGGWVYLGDHAHVIGDTGQLVAEGGVDIGGGTAITKHVSVTATLDFPNTVAPACNELDVTVADAPVGDTVALATPQPPTGGMYSAYVHPSGGKVRVRYCAIITGDPASDDFRVDVWKH